MGCGGMIGVNRGSTEPPRMVKLSPIRRRAPAKHLAMVGKGITYDSGGISIKGGDVVPPGDEDGHVGSRSGALGDVGAEGGRLQDEGHSLADVHGQHAIGLCTQAR